MSSRPLVLKQGKQAQAQDKQIDASVIEYQATKDYPDGSLPHQLNQLPRITVTCVLPEVATVREGDLVILVDD